jgi:hypothetical protein
MKESKVMTEIKKELLIMHSKMTPQARVQAFSTHSRFLMELYEAGKRYRRKNK